MVASASAAEHTHEKSGELTIGFKPCQVLTARLIGKKFEQL